MSNITDLTKYRQDREDDKHIGEMTSAWQGLSDVLKNIGEPICFLAVGFDKSVMDRQSNLHQQIILPEAEMRPEEELYMKFSILTCLRRWLTKSGLAKFDDDDPEVFASFECYKSDVSTEGLSPWNYRAVEVFFAHMTQIAEDFKTDALCFVEIVNEFDKNGWSMVENNLKDQNGNGLIVKVAKPGYGHVVITLHYRRLVDDWKEFEKATAHIPEEEDE